MIRLKVRDRLSASYGQIRELVTQLHRNPALTADSFVRFGVSPDPIGSVALRFGWPNYYSVPKHVNLFAAIAYENTRPPGSDPDEQTKSGVLEQKNAVTSVNKTRIRTLNYTRTLPNPEVAEQRFQLRNEGGDRECPVAL
jgi:hypothetical protein